MKDILLAEKKMVFLVIIHGTRHQVRFLAQKQPSLESLDEPH